MPTLTVSQRYEPLGLEVRCRWSVPFFAVGTASIVAGGLVAAVTRPTHFELGPWVAAFLVLVVGVAQIALGAGQAWLADRQPSSAVIGIELLTWNVGAAGTLVGQLIEVPILTTTGAVATIVAVAFFLQATNTSKSGPRRALRTYRAVAAIILVSTPIGVFLAWTGG